MAFAAQVSLLESPTSRPGSSESTLESPPFLSGGGLPLSATPASDPMVIRARGGPNHHYIGSDPGAPQPEDESFNYTTLGRG